MSKRSIQTTSLTRAGLSSGRNRSRSWPRWHSLAEAYVNQRTAWPRLVYDGDELAAFVLGGFDPQSPVDFVRAGIWRLNVAARHQGKGCGRFAVQTVLDEARRRGQNRTTVLWKPGEHGPEEFYLRLGFRPTGQVVHDQVVGELFLD